MDTEPQRASRQCDSRHEREKVIDSKDLQEAWTIVGAIGWSETQNVSAKDMPDLSREEQEIGLLIGGLQSDIPLPRSEALRQLAADALVVQGTIADSDIPSWAQQLADDVASLTD